MSYAALAQVYDSLTLNVEYEKRADYIHSLLRRYGCETGILLDLACGTGTLSAYLSSFGYDMILVDSSPEMLSVAREKLPEALLLCQDMTDLDLYGTVQGVVCSLDSVNHLLKPCDVKKMFASVSLFLEKGGVFVFDVNTIYKHETVLGNHAFVSEKGDAYCVWQNAYKPKSKTVDISLDIFIRSGNHYERHSEAFSERAYALPDLTKWLGESGFGVRAVLQDMEYIEPREDAQRVYFVAVKEI